MDASILARLFHHAQTSPSKRVYAYLERGERLAASLDYAQLQQNVLATASALIDLGYEGERALLLYANPLEFVQSFLACLAAGVTAVPLAVPSARHAASVAAIARNATIACVLAGRREQQQLQSLLEPELDATPWHCFDGMELETSSGAIRQAEAIAYGGGSRLAFLQYTSGSTGTPKGVMVSHANLMANEAVIGEAMRMHRNSVVVGWLPHFHDMGLIGNLLQPLYQGAECVLMQPVDFIQKPLRWLRAVSDYGGTVSGGPNFAYDLCVAKTSEETRQGLDFSRWEVAFTGAEPIKGETLRRFAAAFEAHGLRRSTLYPCYGMAESTLFITGEQQGRAPLIVSLRSDALTIGAAVVPVAADTPLAAEFVGCGLPRQDARIRIVHPDTLQALPDGHVGEIWAQGGSIALGYYANPQASEHGFAAQLSGEAGNWLRTGDLGVMHAGQLFVVGRLKDVLVVRGRNYYPQDIEHSALLADAEALATGGGAVFQRQAPHDEEVVLVQELTRQGVRQADLPALQAAVRALVIERHGIALADIVFIKPGQLPRTTSGKVRRNRCRELYECGGFEPLDAVEPVEV